MKDDFKKWWKKSSGVIFGALILAWILGSSPLHDSSGEGFWLRFLLLLFSLAFAVEAGTQKEREDKGE